MDDVLGMMENTHTQRELIILRKNGGFNIMFIFRLGFAYSLSIRAFNRTACCRTTQAKK